MSERASVEETIVFDATDERETAAVENAEANEHAQAVAAAEGSHSNVTGSREIYSAAMSAYQEGRYAEAERLFSEVASAGGEQAASAALHEGHAARNGSGCQRAASLYDAVAEQYSSSTVADEASWLAASCYRAMGQLRRAAAHYETLEKRPAFAVRAHKALEEINAQLLAGADKETTTTKGGPPASPGAVKSSVASKPAASENKAPVPAGEPKVGQETAPNSPTTPKSTEPTEINPKDSSNTGL